MQLDQPPARHHFFMKPVSAQPLLGMDGSDAMALFMVVSIPDLAHTYMEPMETSHSNIHASALTYSQQCSWISPLPDVDFS